MMNKAVLSCFFCFLWIFPILASESALKLVKTIGDERDDYTILGLADAVLTEKNDIYILNARGNFVAQYDWQGRFIEKVGQRGQGPKDYSFPRCLVYSHKKLYILDKGNKRIVEINTETGKFEYYREMNPVSFEMLNGFIEGKGFLGILSAISENHGSIAIADKNMKLQNSFFQKFPIDKRIKENDTVIRDGMSVEQAFRAVMYNSRFSPTCVFDEMHQEILVSFQSPDNPVRFFVYNPQGQLLREFSYTIADKKYKFCSFVLDTPIKKLSDLNRSPEHYEIVAKVFFYKNYYGALLKLRDYKAKEKDPCQERSLMVIFNHNGKLVKEFFCNSDFDFLHQCNGYILANLTEAETEQLYIYTLDIK